MSRKNFYIVTTLGGAILAQMPISSFYFGPQARNKRFYDRAPYWLPKEVASMQRRLTDWAFIRKHGDPLAVSPTAVGTDEQLARWKAEDKALRDLYGAELEDS